MKKITLITLAVFLLFLLTACGNKDSQNNELPIVPSNEIISNESAPAVLESPASTPAVAFEPTPEPTLEPTPEPTPEPLIILYNGTAISNISIDCGEEFLLSAATISSETEAVFTCDNPSVLFVQSDGHCKAISAGTANVVATFENSTEVCKITVKAKPIPTITICFWNKPVYDFTMNASANESIQLSAVVDPVSMKDEVVWSTTDASIATVNEDGLVTAIKEGTAKIVCVCGEGRTECWVRVKGVKPTYFYAEDNSTETSPQLIIVFQGYVTTDFTVSVNQAIDLDYKLYNQDDSGVFWTSEDSNIATVDANGVVAGVSEGSTTVTAKCGDLTATTIVRVKNA